LDKADELIKEINTEELEEAIEEDGHHRKGERLHGERDQRRHGF
jgi:hypothetical protein